MGSEFGIQAIAPSQCRVTLMAQSPSGVCMVCVLGARSTAWVDEGFLA